jgi:ribose 5-phosphate isomerase B
MSAEQIWIGNDHGGYDLKLRFLEYFREHGILFHDVGSHSTEIVRYPYQAAEVAGAVSSGLAKRGILICSSGIGMSIVANKFQRVRASVCTSTYMARITRAHNDSNVLCLGGMITGKLEALDMLETWLRTPYEGGRHAISLGLLEQAERKLCAESPDTGTLWEAQ